MNTTGLARLLGDFRLFKTKKYFCALLNTHFLHFGLHRVIGDIHMKNDSYFQVCKNHMTFIFLATFLNNSLSIHDSFIENTTALNKYNRAECQNYTGLANEA